MADRCPTCGQRRWTRSRDLLWVLRHPLRARQNWQQKASSPVGDDRA